MIFGPQPVPLFNPARIDPGEWVAQPKFDGWRVFRDIDGTIYTRHGNVLPIRARGIPRHLPYPLDMELFCFTGRKNIPTRIAECKEGNIDWHRDLVFYVLDIMAPELPLEERMDIVLASVPELFAVSLMECVDWNEVNAYLGKCLSNRCDGVVLKKYGSLYPVSEFQDVPFLEWVKIKKPVEVRRVKGTTDSAG